jgi:bacterioferritin-associated ferredoxin
MAQVDRCICTGVTFGQCLRLVEAGLSLEQVQQRTGCGLGCGLCGPYLQAAIATRSESLPVMTAEQLRALAQRPGQK